MTLFKKKKTIISPGQDRVAGELARHIIKVQLKAASYLNQKASMLSGRAKLVLLILFCVLFTAVNIYLITRSFTN